MLHLVKLLRAGRSLGISSFSAIFLLLISFRYEGSVNTCPLPIPLASFAGMAQLVDFFERGNVRVQVCNGLSAVARHECFVGESRCLFSQPTGNAAVSGTSARLGYLVCCWRLAEFCSLRPALAHRFLPDRFPKPTSLSTARPSATPATNSAPARQPSNAWNATRKSQTA